MPTDTTLTSTLNHPDAGRRGARVFTSNRVENLLARALGIAVVIFGAQAFTFAMMLDLPIPTPAIVAYRLFVFVPVVLVAVAAAVLRGVKAACVAFTIVYLAALLIWPPYSSFVLGGQPGEPWIWYLLTLATACAAVAYPPTLAVIYTLVVPLVFGIARSLGPDGLQRVHIGVLDAIYGIIFGMVIVVLGVLFRQAARRVDAARDAALDGYDRAVRAHAVEAERVEVDALVHDNVLAALQAAERADGPDGERAAVRMAQRALDELRASGAEPDPNESLVTLREMAGRLGIAARMMEHPFTVTNRADAGVVLPQQVANAMGLAAVQAMVNSVQHADGPDVSASDESAVTRSVTIASPRGAATITVQDDGVGFDPDAVPHDRLGLRVSIAERMAAVGGTAEVRSMPGDGAVVVLGWDPRGARP